MTFTDFYHGSMLAVALAAIVSPIATAIINNCHQTKLKKLELQQQNQQLFDLHTREVFENYIRAAGLAVSYATEEAIQGYGASYQLALHYASEHTSACMLVLNSQIRDRDWSNAQTSLDKVTRLLRTDTEKLRTPRPQLKQRKLRRPKRTQYPAKQSTQ